MFIVHNGDWSGEVSVRWSVSDEPTVYEWKVDGEDLISGDIHGLAFYTEIDRDKKIGQVPPRIVGRAVSLAVRTVLTEKIINFVGDL